MYGVIEDIRCGFGRTPRDKQQVPRKTHDSVFIFLIRLFDFQTIPGLQIASERAGGEKQRSFGRD